MPVRIATFADLGAVAEILAAAFDNEELNAYFFPYRKKYPKDYLRAWYHVVLEKWWNYDNIWIVSYDSEGTSTRTVDTRVNSTASQQHMITGAAQWARAGSGSENLWGLYGKWDPRRLLTSFVAAYMSANRFLHPNRAIGQPSAVDPRPMRKWDFGPTIWPFVEHFYTEPEYKRNHWALDVLGVHPKHHKRGFGRELIDWGLRSARREELPAVVIMADGLEDFYRRQGFEVLVGYAYEKDLAIHERQKDGKFVQKVVTNPLRQRGIGGGGIAWTNYESSEEDRRNSV